VGWCRDAPPFPPTHPLNPPNSLAPSLHPPLAQLDSSNSEPPWSAGAAAGRGAVPPCPALARCAPRAPSHPAVSSVCLCVFDTGILDIYGFHVTWKHVVAHATTHVESSSHGVGQNESIFALNVESIPALRVRQRSDVFILMVNAMCKDSVLHERKWAQLRAPAVRRDAREQGRAVCPDHWPDVRWGGGDGCYDPSH